MGKLGGVRFIFIGLGVLWCQVLKYSGLRHHACVECIKDNQDTSPVTCVLNYISQVRWKAGASRLMRSNPSDMVGYGAVGNIICTAIRAVSPAFDSRSPNLYGGRVF